MPTNATAKPIGSEYLITPDDNGQTLFLGDASSSRTAVKTIHWFPLPGFVGNGFSVVARIYSPRADANGVPWLPIPYRRVNLSGAASDRAVVSDSLPANGFLIEVPANAQSISIVVDCQSGSGYLYHWNAVGSAT